MKDRPIETLVSLLIVAAGLVVAGIALFWIGWHAWTYYGIFMSPDALPYSNGRIQITPEVSIKVSKGSFVFPILAGAVVLAGALGVSAFQARRLWHRLRQRKLW